MKSPLTAARLSSQCQDKQRYRYSADVLCRGSPLAFHLLEHAPCLRYMPFHQRRVQKCEDLVRRSIAWPQRAKDAGRTLALGRII